MKTFNKGGIHPPEYKLTADRQIEELPLPEEFRVMLSQCIGAPSKPTVKVGEIVEQGEKIAEAGGFVGAPIHSPVNGTVVKIEPTRTPQGLWQDSIVIKPDLENPDKEFEKRQPGMVDMMEPHELLNIIGESGIVGLGGATFPTRVKLSVPLGKKVDTVIINGAECEPYLTCDDRLMQEEAEKIVLGTMIIMKITDAPEGIIGIEDNKPAAIAKIEEAIKPYSRLRLEVLQKKYPQGSEKQLIYALTGKRVPAGSLPIETGCVVDNVATAYAIYDCIYNNRPLFERIVTVTGDGFSNPGNFKVRNGTPLSFILDFAGGIPEETGKIIAGGPMMGRAVSSLEATSTKGLSGLVAFNESRSMRRPMQPCIRCAQCVSACPMGLEPYLFMMQAQNEIWEGMNAHGVMNCLECGCCSYICPSNRPLVDMIKLGKANLRKK